MHYFHLPSIFTHLVLSKIYIYAATFDNFSDRRGGRPHMYFGNAMDNVVLGSTEDKSISTFQGCVTHLLLFFPRSFPHEFGRIPYRSGANELFSSLTRAWTKAPKGMMKMGRGQICTYNATTGTAGLDLVGTSCRRDKG